MHIGLASIRAWVGTRVRLIQERSRPQMERLRGWAARRPDPIARRQPAWTWATQGAITTSVGSALAVVMVAALVVGPLSGRGSQSGGEPSGSSAPQIPASPAGSDFTPGAEGSPTEGGASPSTSPIPTGPASAPVLASFDCPVPRLYGSLSLKYSVSGGQLYAICGNEVQAIDLATNQITATYKSAFPEIDCGENGGGGTCTGSERAIAVDHWLWASDERYDRTIIRQVNLRNGRVASEATGLLVGSGFGYVFVDVTTNELDVYAPWEVEIWRAADGEYVSPMGSDRLQLRSCNVVWGWTDGRFDTEIERIADDGWTTTIAGETKDIRQIGKECWAVVSDGGADQLLRLGTECVDFRSPSFPEILIEGGAFWVRTEDVIQRLDPQTWETRGPSYRVNGRLISAGSSLWQWTASRLERLDIPIETWLYAPAKGTACEPQSEEPSDAWPSDNPPTQSPSPEPSPTPSPTPGATQTGSATESPSSEPSS
jgi:hypothetical protein